MKHSAKKISVFLLVAWLIVLQLCLPIPALASYKEKTYIVYDAKYEFGNDVPLVDTVAEYLGHFSLDCHMVSVAEWKQGMLTDARVVVYVGLDPDAVLPEALAREIAVVPKVVWFKYGIERLASALAWDDFKVMGHSAESMQVKYNDISFYSWVDAYLTQSGGKSVVLGTVRQGSQQIPLLWQRDNVYYMGTYQAYGEFSWIWSHIFHGIFGQGHTDEARSILFKIKDVSPLSEADVVAQVIKVVGEQNIPFAIEIIPIAISEKSKRYLHENKELVAVLREAQSKGASIILNGYTYQNEYLPQKGEGRQGWIASDDKLLSVDEKFICERITEGIEAILHCGLVPVAFEAPYYIASQQTYKIIANFFNIYSGQVQLANKAEAITMSLPYNTHSKILSGMMVVPETLGFYDGTSRSVDVMLDKTKAMSNVPGAVTTIVYHWYMPVDDIAPLVQGVRDQGYMFLNLRSLPINVRAAGISIVERNGNIDIYIAPEIEVRLQEELTIEDTSIGDIIQGQAVLLVFVAALFIGIIIKLKMDLRKLYESQKEKSEIDE